MAEQETLDERVKRLEDIAFEGDGLTRAVTRLGLNATALGEALMTVDKNQQQLTKLGRQLDNVEAKSATKQDVEAESQKVRAAVKANREQQRGRIYASLILLTAVLAGVALAAANYVETQKRRDYQECLNTSERVTAFADYMRTVRDNSVVPKIRAAADEVLLSLPTQSCEAIR